MADLMTGKYTYKALKSQYKEFKVPAAKVMVGGSNVIGTNGFHLEYLEVNLSLDSASSVVCRFSDCYDQKNSNFNSKVKSKLVLGSKLEIELGYLSSTMSVFEGYIAGVGVNFDEEETIGYEITGLDVRRLMMCDCHYMIHDVKHYSEAFEAVMKPYKKLCSLTVDATIDNLEMPLSQSTTDYDFVTRELIGRGKADREFFVLGNKAYFRKPRSNKTPIMTLGIKMGLRKFWRSALYLDQNIQVVGYDKTGQTQIEEKAQAKSKEKQIQALVASGNQVVTAPDISSPKAAKERAESIARNLLCKSQQGSATCVGMPQIVPGRFIKMDDIDDSMNKSYYIIRVKHICCEHGFTTDFDLEGWE